VDYKSYVAVWIKIEVYIVQKRHKLLIRPLYNGNGESLGLFRSSLSIAANASIIDPSSSIDTSYSIPFASSFSGPKMVNLIFLIYITFYNRKK